MLPQILDIPSLRLIPPKLFISSLSPSTSVAASSISLFPAKSITAYPNWCTPTFYYWLLSVTSHRSRVNNVVIYWATVLWRSPLSQTLIHFWCLFQNVLPPSVQTLPWEPPYQSFFHLVLENPQVSDHVGGNHPRLCIEEKHQLYDSFKEKSRN